MQFYNTKFLKESLAKVVYVLEAKRVEAIKNRVLIKADVMGMSF